MASEDVSPVKKEEIAQPDNSDAEPYVVGLRPWLPWPMSRWRWWTAPIAAERLAAFRIGLAAVLLVDLLLTYAPNIYVWFGEGNLGGPDREIELRHWEGDAQ